MQVEYDREAGTHTLTDDQGGQGEFERIVFACPASAAANMLGDGAGWLESTLLRGLLYHDDDERGFMQATLHNDRNSLPEKHREDILRDAAFVVDVTRTEDGGTVTEFTHNMAGVLLSIITVC
jgi:predicted NAD/FAD-binding protein